MQPGYLFMFGLYGKRPTRDTVALFRRTGAASALLLGRNIDSPAQTRALTEELVQRLGRPVLFAVDHEGGWVLRFKSGLTAFPGNAALGRAGRPELAYEVGERMARQLLPLGIQLNLAPVLDVLTERYNPGIGIRSFGRDPALVSRLGSALIRGLQEHGVSACAKHFPGKGAASVDAHVGLPTIRIPKAELARVHLAPFKAAVAAGAHCVMTSHVRFPALDSDAATFSERITRDILRRRLGFRGVVISDDLCMGAVTGAMPVQLAAARALQAGHDLLIIAHDRQAMDESAELLACSVAEGLVSQAEVDASARRVKRLLDLRRPRSGPPDPAGAERLSRAIAEAAVELVQRGRPGLALEAPLILFPRFSEVAERFTFEGGPRAPARLVRRLLGRGARLVETPVESRALSGLEAAVRRAPSVLFFCFEAMRFPGQKAALELLKRAAPGKTVVCLIRNSWDAALLDRRMTAIDARGFRDAQLRAALGLLLGSKNA